MNAEADAAEFDAQVRVHYDRYEARLAAVTAELEEAKRALCDRDAAVAGQRRQLVAMAAERDEMERAFRLIQELLRQSTARAEAAEQQLAETVDQLRMERLVHAIQEQQLREDHDKAPRWDDDPIVIENGWLDGRCGRCGDALPPASVGQPPPVESSEAGGAIGSASSASGSDVHAETGHWAKAEGSSPSQPTSLFEAAVSVALDAWHAACHAEKTNLEAMRAVVGEVLSLVGQPPPEPADECGRTRDRTRQIQCRLPHGHEGNHVYSALPAGSPSLDDIHCVLPKDHDGDCQTKADKARPVDLMAALRESIDAAKSRWVRARKLHAARLRLELKLAGQQWVRGLSRER